LPYAHLFQHVDEESGDKLGHSMAPKTDTFCRSFMTRLPGRVILGLCATQARREDAGLNVAINAKRQVVDAAARAEAKAVIEHWNEQLVVSRDMLGSPVSPV
jgi:hypothetical protein